ncbi:MAG: hypothetical protein ABRQ25_16450 [Clostridiaceae bacterium]
MNKFINILKTNKELVDAVKITLIFIAAFLVVILQEFKELPFVYNQF